MWYETKTKLDVLDKMREDNVCEVCNGAGKNNLERVCSFCVGSGEWNHAAVAFMNSHEHMMHNGFCLLCYAQPIGILNPVVGN